MKNVKEKLKKKFSVPASDSAAVLEKAAKPGPTLDYSEHTRPMYSTTGKNKPIHNPSANREPPKPATPPKPAVVTDQKTWVQQMGANKKPESLQKSLKSKLATAIAAASTMASMKVDAPVLPASTTSAAVPKAAPKSTQAPKVALTQQTAIEPAHETAVAPQGALVRIHTSHEFPQFLVSGAWHSPRKVSEMLDFLQKNPEHADHYKSAVVRMSDYRRASAGKGKEGFVYPH